MTDFSAYIHIPFCRQRCSYCAFNIYTDLLALAPAYIQALGQEIAWLGGGEQLHTVYWGGGTPSLLPPAVLAPAFQALQTHFRLTPGAEVTLELNPSDAAPDSLAAWRALGVNRLSLGMQSALPAELALYGRDHTLETVIRATERARAAGFSNLSLDLIYGLPGQSLAAWEASLQAALALRPQHFSLYALQIENGTALARALKNKHLPRPDEDLCAEMYALAADLLADYQHYEISSWALAGYESRHNLQYWQARPYFGFGAGAHGYLRGTRTVNTMRPERYIERSRQAYQADRYPRTPLTQSTEALSRAQQQFEYLMLHLRLLQSGLDMAAFEAIFEQDFEKTYAQALQKYLGRGLLMQSGRVIRLAPPAYLIANSVLADFWLGEEG
jgi:oxygen-independent coproporphyrinogen-3 oxidase